MSSVQRFNKQRAKEWRRVRYTRRERLAHWWRVNARDIPAIIGYLLLIALIFVVALAPTALIIALIVAVVRNFW